MTRRMVLAVLCVAAVGCGGGGSGGNAAASREFSYGPAEDASSQANVMQGSLTSMLALQGSAQPSVSDAQGMAQFSSVTSALLGSPTVGVSLTGTSGTVQQRALTRARSAVLSVEDFDDLDFDEACVDSSPTSVTLSNCTITIDESNDGATVTGTITANGSVTLTNSNQTLTWDLTVSANVNASGSGGSASVGLNYHAAGTLTVTAPTDAADGTIDGTMTAELDLRASSGSQSLSIGVDEALALDLTYQADPACVTGGTLEAKRVWTDWNVPGESTRPANEAALVTFTGCGAATIQLGS